MKNFILLFSGLLLAFGCHTQTTGSFQQSITFAETDYSATRTLYYFVPTDYDANQAYPLVVGFRGGPHSNAGQFRDQLSFLADSIGAIILCPENSAHFWNEEGQTKQLFRYAVDTTMAQYNIDPGFIYLTGLSYGGRHAVIVAMDTDDGAIPALRGVIPFATGSEGDLQPNYDAINEFAPACICIGLNDSNNFINVANNLHNDIQANGGNSLLNEIPGVGHTVAFASYPAEMMECINFIEEQYGVINTFDPALSAQLSVFPNPASDQLQLRYPAEWTVITSEITGVDGRKVKAFSANENTLDINDLASGSYFLRLTIEKGVVMKLIIIE